MASRHIHSREVPFPGRSWAHRTRRVVQALAAALAALVPVLPAGAQDTGSARVGVQASAPARGWLGVNLSITRTSDDPVERVVITDVWTDGPAQGAGLRPGDQLLRVNGSSVTGDLFRSMSQRLQPGDPMVLDVLRDGRRVQVQVVAAERPGSEVLIPQRLQEELDEVRGRLVRILEESHLQADEAVAAQLARLHLLAPTIVVERTGADSIITRILVGGEGLPPAREIRLRAAPSGSPPAAGDPAGDGYVVRPLAPFLAGLNRVAGAEMRPLNPGLASYFGVERGVLVTGVEEGTPAYQAGLRGGDVVVAAAGTPVDSLQELRAALGGNLPEPTLQVVRRGARLELRLR